LDWVSGVVIAIGCHSPSWGWKLEFGSQKTGHVSSQG
jgi:hypothetical protein